MKTASHYEWDVFISHASEDTEAIAKPLADVLDKQGLKVWIDKQELTIGDSLRRKIDEGLAKSRYGVVILSPSFFAKEWTKKELDALVSRDDGKEKVLLPVWHEVSKADVAKFSPILADRLAVSSSDGLEKVVSEILRAAFPERKVQGAEEFSTKSPSTSGWKLSFRTPSLFEIKALAVYRGMLYASGEDDNQVNGQLHRYDGIGWIDMNFASKVGVKVDFIESLQVFNDRLYIGTRVDIDGKRFARIYYYDGKAFYLDFSAVGEPGYSGIEDLAIHSDALYAANGSPMGEVYQRRGDRDWITVGNAIETGTPVRALASYRGCLYAGTGAFMREPKVWQWMGDNWLLIRNFRDDNIVHPDSVFSLVAHKDFLYAGLAGGGNKSPILAYDGTSWAISHSVSGSQYARLAIVGNRLWVGAHGGQVFYCQDDLTWQWEEIDSISGVAGILDLAQYGDFVYAGTFGYKGIYRLKLREDLRS